MVIPKKDRPNLHLDERDLIRRACAAYYKKRRALVPDDQFVDVQNFDYSELAEHNGCHYVVLRNINGIVEVYRVRNDGVLKCLKRVPKALAEQYE